MKFEIVTPERVVLKVMASRVTVPTREGEITIMPHHIPLVSILESGVIELESENGEVEIMSVSGGFIEVLKDKVIILADTAERAMEIDLGKAEEARDRAEDLKKQFKTMDAMRFADLNTGIAKELARTKAVRRWKKMKGMDGINNKL